MTHSPGKIFLNEQRGQIQNPLFQRNCIFNFGSFFSEHKSAMPPLYLFNEENLAGKAHLDMEVSDPSCVILIPITGDLEYTDFTDGKTKVPVGKILIRHCSADWHFRIGNPYEAEVISFLQIWIASSTTGPFSSLLDLNPGIAINQMVTLTDAIPHSNLAFQLSLGQFDGRAETTYHKQGKAGLLFCYVIAGAFEVEGRLLHAQDGLSLWDTSAVELEALSNNALILMIEY